MHANKRIKSTTEDCSSALNRIHWKFSKCDKIFYSAKNYEFECLRIIQTFEIVREES